jgi:hypothetical protein
MEIKVLIVDDKPIFGKSLKNGVLNFESSFEGITYIPEVIACVDAYDMAQEFIQAHEKELDILLFDYNIETHRKGTDLFQVIDTSKYLIYKILHSITSKSSYESQELENLYDDFRYSKYAEDINNALVKYESNVLRYKLKGNPLFQQYYETSSGELNTNATEKVFDDIRFYDVLYAKTDVQGNEILTVYYRDVFNGTTAVKTVERKISISTFKKQSSLLFRRPNGSMIINLLWVANIDLVKNKIRFITLDNAICEEMLDATNMFETEISTLLDKVISIPQYFKD